MQSSQPETTQRQDQAAASEASQKTGDSGRASTKSNDAHAVRFSSAIEEIAPGLTPLSPGDQPLSPDLTSDQHKDISKALQERPLQQRRMNTYQFEPMSLPASRVPSRDEESSTSSRLPTPISPGFQHSPNSSPKLSALTSPPLTPEGSAPTGEGERKASRDHDGKTLAPGEPQIITPQPSTSQEKSPRISYREPLTHRPASSDQILQRSTSAEDRQAELRSHRRGIFQGGGSVPVSRESSPARSSASNFYSKPMTPGGDANDPYAKGRRPTQQQASRHHIEPRFVFSRKQKSSPASSKTNLSEKRSSAVFGGRTNTDDTVHSDIHSSNHGHHHGSMSDLKRFFKKGGHKKRESSPAPSVRSGAKTPPGSRSSQQLPFSDDHGLSSKYGKIGKVLGSGAGGSVRLMKRKDDNTVFAVKEFRARHTYETEKEYNKKVTAEFCVGSTLHHGNIIETLDILHEKGRWYEVMEYAPFDLFAIVMTGRMQREEVTCCFLQILNGVTYLHSLGLAHRDLKLDNVVVSDKGIMKIIDFGSAHVFKYPFESDPVPAKGIVGSDPYLAPEVYDSKEYDAAAVDIWSLAIIFCCMSLRRFPWKLPRMTDNSYKLFAAEPTPGHDPKDLVHPSRSTEHSSLSGMSPLDEKSHRRHHHSGSHRHSRAESTNTVGAETESTTGHGQGQAQGQGQQPSSSTTGERKEVIKGPWRILRLLPRESRYIIWRMLDTNPATRATMGEILEEPWVADTVICQQLDNGEVIPADDHEHVLEPPSSQQPPSQQKA